MGRRESIQSREGLSQTTPTSRRQQYLAHPSTPPTPPTPPSCPDSWIEALLITAIAFRCGREEAWLITTNSTNNLIRGSQSVGTRGSSSITEELLETHTFRPFPRPKQQTLSMEPSDQCLTSTLIPVPPTV